MKDQKLKVFLLVGLTAFTLAIHYGWVLIPLFGHAPWVHALHGRFCYVPIVVGAAWFGIRGGMAVAALISLLVLPYILSPGSYQHDYSSEIVEIFFYFALAALTGAIMDREMLVRRRQEETQLQLERAHKLSLIGQMAAGIAHEIKNPLASIKGAVEIINDSKTPESERREFVAIVSNEIKRVDGTIREFLDFARPRDPQKERFDLSEMATSVAKQLETQASARQLEVKTDIQVGIDFNGDKEKIRQVLLNLGLNAIEASDSGKSMDLCLRKTGSGTIELSVRDYGNGVPTEALDKVFEPFYTTKPSGSGLGLAVVKTIVEKHNGFITVDSRPGRGATFVVTLPITMVQL